MRALIQRVTWASVEVDRREVARIGAGMLVFLGVQRDDEQSHADAMVARLLAYRLFADAEGRMNRDVRSAGGGILLVSQFTLAADTGRGLRPGFSTAAAPDRANVLYERVLADLCRRHEPVAAGIFGASMQVSLCNDGPVTFLLQN